MPRLLRMGYRLTRKADADVVDIYLYGARTFGTAQAERYHEGLVRAFGQIAADPHLARERTDLTPPVRLSGYESHVIIYRIEPNRDILIVRILHGRQDWMRHL